MSTVVGSIIVYTILVKIYPDLGYLLLLPKDNKLEYYHFIFLALYGLTFSYIASAPILVFHASRFSFKYSDGKGLPITKWFACALIMMTAFLIFAYIFSSYIIFSYLKILIIVLILAILIPQWVLILNAMIKINKNFDFYSQLSSRRVTEKRDIIESYKHLREHGNSFSILFYEIVLGSLMVIIGHDNINYALVFIFLWILPAVFVWFIGTGLENRFSQS